MLCHQRGVLSGPGSSAALRPLPPALAGHRLGHLRRVRSGRACAARSRVCAPVARAASARESRGMVDVVEDEVYRLSVG